MKLLADQCCHTALVAGLRQDGHDVWYVKESAAGAEDGTVLQASVQQERILLTEDKDFGEMVVKLNLPAFGIVLLRFQTPDVQVRLSRLRDVLRDRGHQLAGSFVVVTEDRVRFRPLGPSTAASP